MMAAFVPLQRWADSGLMFLSGAPDGPPALPTSDTLGPVHALWTAAAHRLSRLGGRQRWDARLLTERAALARLTRGGLTSCSRKCRLLEARDGWIAVNLARASDVARVPAWLCRAVRGDPWRAIAAAARRTNTDDLVEAAQQLGIAVGAAVLPAARRASPRGADDVVELQSIAAGSRGARDWSLDRPLVVDLSALWAGPLCGQLLAEAGARVIKVESAGRPDSIRDSSPAFFDLLNAGKESVVLDFASSIDRARLAALIARADAVISSARPRAFEQLGLEPEAIAARNPGLVWVAITAYGWRGPNRNRVGFGDDAAAAGGLLTRTTDGRPMFVGDAVADPITGVAAAAGAIRALLAGGGRLVDASLVRTSSFVAGGAVLRAREDVAVVAQNRSWELRLGRERVAVASPRVRPRLGVAAPYGSDTRRVLGELCRGRATRAAGDPVAR
jgi:CoA transferase family III